MGDTVADYGERWGNFQDYLLGPELWLKLGEGAFDILVIVTIAYIVIKLGKKLTSEFFFKRRRGPFKITKRREDTLRKLFGNILTYFVYFTAFVMILETFGLKIGPLLAGAGVAGLAIGFGAQSLVKDIITGFFIIFEDQFSVGDYVRTAGIEGFVEEIGLKTCKIKSWTGEVHIIPNGNITQVTNYSIHNSIAVVDVSIAYEGNIERAEAIILELLEELPDKYEPMITVPELLGVQNLGASDVVLRIVAEVYPMEHWAMARAIRKEVKNRLDERGIEIPFPRLVMYSRQDEVEAAKIKENV
ncbi:mechanosensitive ion channel family protein [Thalassobacillus hwangdonensis]|uniref:Mechanosensitive ion channel family protein n=1 Tax=Thalassobacillus hwangdonensis TaxID=546108 RepID=A0ABW3L0V4_9BACI